MKWIPSAVRMVVPVPALMALLGCCSYTAVPDATPMIAGGATVPVNVATSQTSCTWTYQSNASWITVGPDPDSTGQTGTGNGRVLVAAAVNGGASRRTGTATVAGKTVTVDQAGTGGSGCTFQVAPIELTFTGGTAGTGQFTITASAQDCGWRASRTSVLEDTVNLTSGGSGSTGLSGEERFGLGNATIVYQVKAQSATSPWPAGGGNIVVRDSAQQTAATHHVKLP